MTTSDTATSESSADDAVVFNPLEEGFVAWPYDQYRRLRAADPVHWSELLQGWVLTRYDDVNKVLRDATISVDIANANDTPAIVAERGRLDDRDRGAETLVLRDDPDHARLRKLLQGPFRPRAIDGQRSTIEEHVDRAVEQLRATHEPGQVIDLVSDFAYPLPVEIFCEMLGIPDEDQPQFRKWTMDVARNLDPMMSEAERAECMQSVDDMRAYLEALVEVKRTQKADDVLSELIHAEEDGERLNHEELMAQLMTLYVAGHEPTAGLIGNGMLALLRAGLVERLQAEPELRANAISELLRYDGPNQFVRRIATAPLDLGGTEVGAGELIFASPGAANRDPARWGDTADEVVLDRPDAGQHLQFGAGIHACLGSHFARAQAEVAFAALFDRFEGLELAGEAEWSRRMVIRGLARLPVTCRAIH
jgi:cytochrome P450